MAVDIPAVREIVERVFARQDVLDACKRRRSQLAARGPVRERRHPGPDRYPHGDTARTPERVQDAQARSDRYVDVRGVR